MTYAQKTLVAVPTRGKVQWQTVERLNAVRDQNHGLPPIHYAQGGLSVAQTRNDIAAYFMASDYHYLVMVDDDIVPPFDLLKLTEKPVEMGVVALPYVMWAAGAGCYLSVYDDARDGGIKPRSLEPGLNMVDVAGTGCMAFSKHVFGRMPNCPFHVVPNLTHTEDIIFCREIRKEGMDVMAWWDGSFADHVKEMGLGSLMQEEQRQRWLLTWPNAIC